MARTLPIPLVLLLALAAPAGAAPVQTQAQLRVELNLVGFSAAFVASGAGTVSVTGSQVFVPFGLIALSQPLLVPVTGSTAIGALSVPFLTNLSGTFSFGGVTAQAPGEVCGTGPAVGEACNQGGGFGGTMGFTGSILWPAGIVPIPLVVFGTHPLGKGGSATIPFTADGAAWSTGPGFALGAGGASTVAGGASPLNLVTPAYVDALGTEIFLNVSLTLSDVTVPEPRGWALLTLGVLGLAVLRRTGR